MAVIVSYPIGVLWHKMFRPHVFWNPGPYSVKEHVIVYTMAHASSVPYGMENVVSQAMPTLMNDRNITFFHSLAFVFITQFTGLAFAGLARRFLVKPSTMMWPSTFSTLALFASMHNFAPDEDARADFHQALKLKPSSSESTLVQETGGADTLTHQNSVDTLISKPVVVSIKDQDSYSTVSKVTATQARKPFTTSRQHAFWYSFLGMYLYTFIPEFFFPALQTISICTQSSFSGLVSGAMGTFNAISSSTNGVGLFSFTFDWYYIQSAYLTTPWWAILCCAVGKILFSWVGTIALFLTNTWGLSTVISTDNINPVLNSVKLFNGNPNSTTHKLGSTVDPAFFYNAQDNYNLNSTAYDNVSPIHVTSFFAVQYGSTFLTIASVLSHVSLWYGTTIVRQTKSAWKQAADSIDALDIHNQLMNQYWDVPDLAFLVFALFMATCAFLVSLFTPFVMPWWGVLLNMTVTAVLIVPIGIIYAISGIPISISVLAEFLMGSIIPGQTVAVMAFKSLALNNINQGLLLAGGLKIGHYLHVPPVAVVAAQLLGTFINCVVATAVSWWMMFSSGLPNKDAGEWQYIVYQTFYSDGAVWGAIGPRRFFGIGSLYEGLLWCFLIGFLCPFGPWLCDRYIYKASFWRHINFPLIFTLSGVGGFQNAILTPLIVGFMFQVVVFKYWTRWYQMYNFVMASAFDTGFALSLLTVSILGNFVNVPFNALNPNLENVPLDYYCYAGASYLDFDCKYYSNKNSSDPRACL
ncbi:OPT oligopeptide transporter protein-domain-containing protein [Obelidium mucronatum]|nr:OPT oligopeptide transporter protein-domain-containing protein [Obelidium mucronatum]